MNITKCKAGYSKKFLDSEFKFACKIIKQANKGLPHPVEIDKNYKIIVDFESSTFRMKITYSDGYEKLLDYYIAL